MTVFCDWLSIYQQHFQDVPLVNDGKVFSVDVNGEIKWEVCSKVKHRGSHETSLHISSDGNRVYLSGNIGRFNRSDNVFGYSVPDCIRLANEVLAGYGLPPFTDGAPMALNGKGGSDAGFQATHAVITRVDLTKNYATGSAGRASQFIRYLQGFKSGKFEPMPYKSVGVSWGEGSKYWYAKVYDKAADYLRHRSKASEQHDSPLYEYLLQNGIVRHEITLKSRYLKQNNLWRFIQWEIKDMENPHEVVYALFSNVISDSGRHDELLEIPGRAGELAVAWRDGADILKRVSRPTFYRYRKQLLQYGIDIAVPANVSRLPLRIEVITVSACAVPHWYQLPKVA